MQLSAPKDIRGEVGEYLGPAAWPLGATCRQLRALNPHKQYQVLTTDCCDLPNKGVWCGQEVRTAEITVVPCGITGWALTKVHKRPFAMAMATLGGAPKLHALTLTVANRSRLGNAGAKAIAQLRHLTSLRNVIITARYQKKGPAGAQTVARLGTLRQAETLALNLHGNHIQKTGAKGLADLSQPPTIRNLNLGLGENKIGDGGAMALGRLNRNQPLQTLSLNMSANGISNRGVGSLSRN